MGALVERTTRTFYYWWTGQITLKDLLTIDVYDLWNLVDEEMIGFMMFLPGALLITSFLRWCYQRDVLLKSAMKRIENVPKPKDKQKG